MRRRNGALFLTLLLTTAFLTFQAAAPPRALSQEREDTVLVGRISHVEGELLRYVPEEKDWVSTAKDAPFGLDDALSSGDNSRAELILPNNTWVRVDENSQIQMLALKEDLTEVDVASGVARFHNRSATGIIRATTPFGQVVAKPGTVFDVYVGNQSAEVVAVKGQVDFLHEPDEARYEVKAGTTSLIADSRDVTAGSNIVDRDWNDWNEKRDSFWSKRVEVRGDSAKYLPEGLRYDAADLDDHGRWEKVYYDGDYHRMWRPERVSTDWSPYSVGRWTTYYGDQCWIPYEPFGYVTHHYGSWIYIGNLWYWAPPVPRRPVHVVSPLSITFSWYPGRVAWIHRDRHVGWVPLAPREVYYGHRYWGPRTVVINQVNIYRPNIHIHKYRHIERAVIIDRDDFYRAKDYRKVRIHNKHHTNIVNHYQAAPVINNTVINNFSSKRERYRMDDRVVHKKPHPSAVDRIFRNQNMARDRRNEDASMIEQNLSRTRVRKVEFKETVPKPRATRRLVAGDKVGKPTSQPKLEGGELRRRQREFRGNEADSVQETARSRDEGGNPRRLDRRATEWNPGEERKNSAERIRPRSPRTDRAVIHEESSGATETGRQRRLNLQQLRRGQDLRNQDGEDQGIQAGEDGGRSLRPPRTGRNFLNVREETTRPPVRSKEGPTRLKREDQPAPPREKAEENPSVRRQNKLRLLGPAAGETEALTPDGLAKKRGRSSLQSPARPENPEEMEKVTNPLPQNPEDRLDRARERQRFEPKPQRQPKMKEGHLRESYFPRAQGASWKAAERNSPPASRFEKQGTSASRLSGSDPQEPEGTPEKRKGARNPSSAFQTLQDNQQALLNSREGAMRQQGRTRNQNLNDSTGQLKRPGARYDRDTVHEKGS